MSATRANLYSGRAGSMVLGAVAQCLWVEGSARPAVLYRLGAFTPPLELRAAVHDRAGVVLAAQLQLLDARFRPIVVRRFSEFVARGRSWTTTAFANAGDGIAYVLLTSDPDWRDRTHRRNSGESQPIMVATPAAVFAIANGHERSEDVVFGELGEFTLQASVAPSAADEG